MSPSGLNCLKDSTLLWQNLFAPRFFKELFSAVRALLRRRSKDEIDDGVAYGGHGWLRRRPVDSFFPPRVCEAAVLQEGVCNHSHQGVTMKTLPRSPFEVIESKLLFQLLMRLLANPSCLDGRGQCAQIGRRGQIGQIVFLLP